MEIAQEILRQLGGRRFIAMTGAKLFVGTKNSLQFRLPSSFASSGINHVEIVLDPSDTYTIKFRKIRGTACNVIREVSDVYCDMLVDIFESETGLRCSL